jgi:serine/threonine-protein kinase
MPPAASPQRRDYPAGQLIPGTVYKVLRHIATGGMGTVYDVEDTTVGRKYVLKTLHPELGDRQDLTRRMIKEARALAQLHHPNIVEVYTAGMTADQLRLPYYVMERLDGQSLRTVLEKRKSLELQHAYEIAVDLCDALDCAHEKQIIHRDVKPDNIFLHRMRNGATVTKLLDFGIMRVLDAKGETAGRFLGTLRYAAPEQLRGDNIGPHTDIYAVGLVIYEMLSGRGPFDEEKDLHMIGKAHLTRAAPPLSSFAKVPLPPALEEIVARTLAKDPRARPRDAFSLAKELRELAQKLRAPAAPSMSATSRPTAVNVLAPLESRAAVASGAPPASSTDPDPEPKTPLVAQNGHADPTGTVRGMTPPTVRGATLQDAPPSVPATLASEGVESAAPGPIDRRAPTRSYVYDDQPGKPTHGTEAATPPIAVTASADPFGLTQKALAPPPPMPPGGFEGDLGALLSDPPPIPTQGSWQSGDAPISRKRLETTSPSSRARRTAILAGATLFLSGVVVASILFIAQRVKARAVTAPPPSEPTAILPTASSPTASATPSAATTATPAPTASASATPSAVPSLTPTQTPAATRTHRPQPAPTHRDPPAPTGSSALPNKLPGSGL